MKLVKMFSRSNARKVCDKRWPTALNNIVRFLTSTIHIIAVVVCPFVYG